LFLILFLYILNYIKNNAIIFIINNMEVTLTTNDVNNYSVSELNYIRETIENMNKFNQIEVLRILNKHSDVTLNENKYGIHINLSELRKEILDEMNIYIKYVNTQEIALNKVEKQKEDYKNTYFSKDIKDNSKLLNK
jgi:hypothetical protein